MINMNREMDRMILYLKKKIFSQGHKQKECVSYSSSRSTIKPKSVDKSRINKTKKKCGREISSFVMIMMLKIKLYYKQKIINSQSKYKKK